MPVRVWSVCCSLTQRRLRLSVQYTNAAFISEMWWLLHCRQRWHLKTSCQYSQLEQALSPALEKVAASFNQDKHGVTNTHVCGQNCNMVSVLCETQVADKKLQKKERLVQRSAINGQETQQLERVCSPEGIPAGERVYHQKDASVTMGLIFRHLGKGKETTHIYACQHPLKICYHSQSI